MTVSLGLGLSFSAYRAVDAAAQQTAQPAVVLDRVVAVVNNQAILTSDLDEELQLAILDPGQSGHQQLTRKRALDQLIGRTLIQQQIRQQDVESTEPSPSEIDERLNEVRRQMPACIRENCATDAGWTAFLAARQLTPQRAQTYMRYRLQILRFIETRFRQGIRIAPQEIEDYYRDSLLPQYAAGETRPTLDSVAPRIEEILLQQQVNALFDDWLQNLRKQGEIEVLDPELAPDSAPSLAPSPEISQPHGVAAHNNAGGPGQ
ncbi:MAG: peptidylprolyl isomerase [Tepidisphaeraceae bacterium]